MSESQDKNLPATERKLQKTREEGQGARSRDLSHLAILGTGALLVLMGTQPMINHLREAMARQLVFNAATAKTPALMLERFQSMLMLGLGISVIFALVTTTASVLRSRTAAAAAEPLEAAGPARSEPGAAALPLLRSRAVSY